MYSVFWHLQHYYKGLVAEQMAVMIHHSSAIQKQQLLCRCGTLICKMIPFSWKAASESNPCNLGENRSGKSNVDRFMLLYCILNVYECITTTVLQFKAMYCGSSIKQIGFLPIKSAHHLYDQIFF